MTASDFLRLLRAGKISIAEYAAACADRIEQFDPALHAFAYFDRAAFDGRVEVAETRWRAERNGHLPGVPVGVKDIFNTYDMPTSMGSEILAGYRPGNDARVVSNIRQDGGIIAGKTVSAEFAVHHPGPTVNPWDPRRTPGTSSSGSAAAVAAHMVPIALSSQTAGSTIRPASYCGVMGFKPSFGLLPRTAMLKTTDTLDSVGFMARSVEDVRLMFEVIRVRGHNYPVSEAALNDHARQAPPADRRWRIGLLEGPKTVFERPAPRAQLASLARRLADAGAEIDVFRLAPAFDGIHELHQRIYCCSLAYYFKAEWQSSAEKMSPELHSMITDGLKVSPEHYAAALDEQTRLARAFDVALRAVDVLLCLSTADEAPVGLEGQDIPDHCLVFTMCGAPALSLPLLKGTTGLPVGAQLVARRYEDYKLLACAEFVARAAQ